MLAFGKVGTNFGSILRFPSTSRKSKDGGSNAKRQRAQTYDVVDEYKGGSVQKDPGARKDEEEGASPTGAATRAVDDEGSSGSMSTGNSDSRQPLRESNVPRNPPLDPRQLEQRQEEEKNFIRKHDSSEASVWYIIDVNWLQAWKHFVTRGSQVPGPIDNARLVDRHTGRPKPDLHAVDDYRGVNREIWQFWQSRYGGGPVIRRSLLDLYAPEPEESPEHSRGALHKELPLPGAAPAAARHDGASGQRRSAGTSSGEAATSRAGTPAGRPSREEDGTPSSRAVSSVVQPPAKRSGGSMFSLGGRSSSSRAPAKTRADAKVDIQGSTSSSGSVASAAQAARGGVVASGSAGGDARGARRSTPGRSGGPAPAESKALCCDKCDGPHETDKCPHFKKAREKHQDAWSSYGKVKKGQDAEGDGAPIVRHARVVQQPGDGSCLFHSLCYGLNEGSTASSLRRDICGYIAKNPEMRIADTAIEEWIRYDSNDTVAQYAERMRSGTWGGGIEMAALMQMKGVNVHVYEKCREGYRRISAFDCPNARKTVSVLYQGRMHYDAIVV